MNKILFAALALFLVHPAFAGSSNPGVQTLGAVTAGHTAQFYNSGIIQDGGTLSSVPYYDVRLAGAVPDAVYLTDATVSGTTLTSASATFTSADVGKSIKVTTGNTNVAVFRGTISAFIDAHDVTLSGSVLTTCSTTCKTYYGTDNASNLGTAFTNAIALSNSLVGSNSGNNVHVVMPTQTNGGGYLFASQIDTTDHNGVLTIDAYAPLYSNVGIGTTESTVPILWENSSVSTLNMNVLGGVGPQTGDASYTSHNITLNNYQVLQVGFFGQKGLSCKGFGWTLGKMLIQNGSVGYAWDSCQDIHGLGGEQVCTGTNNCISTNGTEDVSMNASCDTVTNNCLRIDYTHSGIFNGKCFNNSSGAVTGGGVSIGSVNHGSASSGLTVNFDGQACGGNGLFLDNTAGAVTVNLNLTNTPSNSGYTHNFSNCVSYGTTGSTGPVQVNCTRDAAIADFTGTQQGMLTVSTPTRTSFDQNVTTTGNVGIGTTAPTAGTSLDMSYNTNSALLPIGTTGARPTGVNGMIRYNSAYSGSNGAVEAFVNSAWIALGGTLETDITPTGANTYTPNPLSTWFKVRCSGGGGQGGGGAAYNSGTASSGGAGGAGGLVVEATFTSSEVTGATTVTVGAGGSAAGGGAGSAGNPGTNGSNGGNTTFGSLLTAYGGGGGTGGSTSNSTGGGGAGYCGSGNGSSSGCGAGQGDAAGTASSDTSGLVPSAGGGTAVGAAGNKAGSCGYSNTGGGSGAGVASTPAALNGGSGGAGLGSGGAGGGAGNGLCSGAGAGTAGTGHYAFNSGGGGGGGNNSSASGCVGGAGGAGAGGGGGGSGLTGGGNGGVGGNGYCRIVEGR